MTTPLTAAEPVGEAIFGLLQDATLLAAVAGRVVDSVPQDTPRPLLWYEIVMETDQRGLGTGGLPEVEIRTHVFSDIGSLAEAQRINRLAVALLKDAGKDTPLVITGYTQCGSIVYHDTQTLHDQELNGVKVHEVVSNYTLWAEQQ